MRHPMMVKQTLNAKYDEDSSSSSTSSGDRKPQGKSFRPRQCSSLSLSTNLCDSGEILAKASAVVVVMILVAIPADALREAHRVAGLPSPQCAQSLCEPAS